MLKITRGVLLTIALAVILLATGPLQAEPTASLIDGVLEIEPGQPAGKDFLVLRVVAD